MSIALPPKISPTMPSPFDRFDWRWATYWAIWFFVGFGVPEWIALHQDEKYQDRVKRTLSSVTRFATAWDTITGLPLDVPWGRVRRLLFVILVAWFPFHIIRPGTV